MIRPLSRLAMVCVVGFPWSPAAIGDEPPATTPSADLAIESSTAPTLVVEAGHTKPVVCAAFSADSSRLATGSDDHSVRIWNVPEGDVLQTLIGHTDTVLCVRFSPDGRRLLTGSWDKTARLWDLATGTALQVVRESESVYAADFSPDGRRVLIATDGLSARVLDADTCHEICRLAVPDDVRCATWSPDGQTIAIAARSGQIRLWNVGSGKEIRSWESQLGRCDVLRFLADGKHLLGGGLNGATQLWRVEDGNEVQRFSHTTTKGAKGKDTKDSVNRAKGDAGRPVLGLGCSPDSLAVYVADLREITRWNPFAAQIEQSMKLKVDFSGNLRGLISPTSGSKFYHQKGMPGVAFSRDCHWAACWAYGRSATLIDLSSGKNVRQFDGAVRGEHCVRFMPDGRRLWSDTGMVWDLAAGCASQQPRLPPKAKLQAFHGDGRMVVATGPKDSLRWWDMIEGKERQRFKGQKSPVLDCCVSADGKWLATGSVDKKVRWWDIATGQLLATWDDHKGPVRAVRFSSDGHYLISGSDDKSVHLRDLRDNGTLKQRFKHANWVWAVGFTPDGRQAYSTGNQPVRLWDVETGKEIRHFDCHFGTAHCATMSRDGKLLAAGGTDGTACIWDVTTGKQLHRLSGHRDWLHNVTFSPDSAWLLTSGYDNLARLWNVATGKEIATLVSFRNGDWAVIDPQWRYDGANAGDIAGLHWLIQGECVSLYQLKDFFYEPGLLAKLTGFNHDRRLEVRSTDRIKLFPETQVVEPTADHPKMTIHLFNRGGGIGRVVIRVNGKELQADARGKTVDPSAADATIDVALADDARVIPGAENRIEVQVYNAAGDLCSRGTRFRYIAPGQPDLSKPHLWAIVVGTSRYLNPGLNLNLAAKDAEDFGAALKIAAGRLLASERVHVRVFSTRAADAAGQPTRANLESAFVDLAAARQRNEVHACDILVVYLAGHGTSRHNEQTDEFYYLTSEAVDDELKTLKAREETAISGADLRRWIKDANVKHQVLILDTCSAGTFIKNVAAREVPSSQARALEQIKDSAGAHILAGCPADAQSFEAPQFGHGLLTHSLLLGMSGPGLRDDGLVEVTRLFRFAVNEVSQLTANTGLVQRPRMANPVESGTDDYPIGRMNAEDKRRMPVENPRAIMLRTEFQDEERLHDALHLAGEVNREFRERSFRGSGPVFYDTTEMRGAYRIAGRYRVENDALIVDMVLIEEGKDPQRFRIHGTAKDLPALAHQIADQAESRIHPSR